LFTTNFVSSSVIADSDSNLSFVFFLVAPKSYAGRIHSFVG
jgi:hypothetical protein